MASSKLTTPQSWNHYSYALNKPLTVLDPNGLDPEDQDEEPEDPGQGPPEDPRPRAYRAIDAARANHQRIALVNEGILHDTLASGDQNRRDVAEALGMDVSQVIDIPNNQNLIGGMTNTPNADSVKYTVDILWYALQGEGENKMTPDQIITIAHSKGIAVQAAAFEKLPKVTGFGAVFIFEPASGDVNQIKTIVSRSDSGAIIKSDRDSALALRGDNTFTTRTLTADQLAAAAHGTGIQVYQTNTRSHGIGPAIKEFVEGRATRLTH